MIPLLAKIATLYRDWLKSLRKEKVNYLSCIGGKGDGKDIHCNAQNAALFVDLLKISFITTTIKI